MSEWEFDELVASSSLGLAFSLMEHLSAVKGPSWLGETGKARHKRFCVPVVLRQNVYRHRPPFVLSRLCICTMSSLLVIVTENLDAPLRAKLVL